MTIPSERTRAIIQTREFLISLLDTKQTPKVPKSIRMQARSLLRHYPSHYDMIEASKKLPYIFTIE